MHRNIIKHSVCISFAIVFISLGIPLPWLFGPLFACLLIAILGIKIEVNKLIGDTMRTLLGVAAGASITPIFFIALPNIITTLCLVFFLTLTIGTVGVFYFKRIGGYDFNTAYYASMPGGLPEMIVLGEEAGANIRALSLAHATRVLVIVTILPIIFRYGWQIDLSSPPGQSVVNSEPLQLILIIMIALLGWRLAKWTGIFGAAILGPLILAAAAALSGVLTTRPPAEFIWAAQYFIATGIGVKYVGITSLEIKRDVSTSLGFCIILGFLTTGAILFAYWWELAPTLDIILAVTPGGQAELLVLALVIGADMSFVVAHQLLRVFSVILGAPIIAKIFSSKLEG